jgi:hypothetical protein
MTNSEIGYAVTALAAGIGEFEEQLHKGQGILEDEGFIPLYQGAGIIEPRRFESWEQIERAITGLEREAEGISGEARRLFLERLLDSLRTAARLFAGEELGYQEKLQRLVGIPAEPIRKDFLETLEERIYGGLADMGYKRGTLRERIEAWETANAIPADAVPGLYRELMAEAKERTDQMVVPTGDYMMELNPVRNTYFTARCKFFERKMDLNVENSFSRAALKHLIAHEAFPGHSTQNIYTLAGYRDGSLTADVLLCSLNGVPGVIQEGIGDQGVHLIDWIEDEQDELQADLRRYQSAVATQAAWKINVEGESGERVHEYLRETGGMQEARSASRIAMARHPYRAPFIASYFYGNEAVRHVRRAVQGDQQQRSRFIAELYGQMHCPESLCLAAGVTYRSYGET